MQIKKTKLLPPYLLVMSLIVMYLLDKYFPLFEWQGTSLLGIVLMLSGFLCILYCAYQFHNHHTEIKPLEESTFLILSWPYTISRNPIYLCMILFLVAWCLFLQSISCVMIVIAFSIWINFRFVLLEEVMLEKTFGGEYLAYKQTTRRWL